MDPDLCMTCQVAPIRKAGPATCLACLRDCYSLDDKIAFEFGYPSNIKRMMRMWQRARS